MAPVLFGAGDHPVHGTGAPEWRWQEPELPVRQKERAAVAPRPFLGVVETTDASAPNGVHRDPATA